MSDVISQLSEQELADLSALADGTLPAERRAAVEARVAASPELRELVERQLRSLAATQALASEEVPESLRATVESRARPRDHRRDRARRLVPRVGLAGALAAGVAVAAVLLTGGPVGPTVAEAAQLADRPASGPAPSPLGESGTRLDLDVEGVVFPDLARAFGWQAVGVRRDQLDGREAVTVFYEKGARRIAYVIVSGPGLPRPPGAREGVYGGVTFHTLPADGGLAVTWRRDGLTCILIGDASRDELITLASWRGGGTLRY